MDSEVIYAKFFLMFFAILLFVVAVLMIVNKCKLIKSCTHRIMSQVSHIEKIAGSDTIDTYRPIFKFIYNGKEYFVSENFASSNCRFKIGDQVELFIDPDDPEKFYCHKRKIIGLAEIILLLTAVFFTFLFTRVK